MPNVRISELSTTATETARDDYFAIDSQTNGTRKVLVDKVVGGIKANVQTNTQDITDLKEDFDQTNDFLGNQLGIKNYLFTNNGYITTSGTTANINNVVSNAVMSWAVVPCTEGDTFIITGTGASQGRLWAFIDANGNVLSKEPTAHYKENLEITAPENTAYLVVNARMDTTRSLTSGNRKFLNDTDATIIYDDTEIHAEKYPIINFTITAQTIWSASSYVKYALIPMTKNTEYRIVNNNAVATYIAILKDARRASNTSPNCSDAYTSRITIPENGGHFEFITPDDAEVLAVQIVNNTSQDTNPQITAKAVAKPKTIITDDMMWSWWVYPTMQSFTRVRDKLYWTYTDANGDSGIASYNFRNGEVKKTPLKHVSGATDDHNGIAFNILASGQIVCAYSTGHNADNFMHVRRSKVNEDIETFLDPVDLECAGNTTYAQLFTYNVPGQSAKLYLFYRTNSGHAWAYRISSNYGKDWSEETILITSAEQYYCAFRKTTTGGVLRVCMTSNPDANDRVIRQAFLHLPEMELYDSDNQTLLGTSNINNTNVSTLIGLTSGYDTQRLFDIGISDIESPMILYAPFNLSSNNDSVYKLYNAGTVTTICNGGNALWNPKYQLGATFKNESEILVARNENNVDIVELYGIDGTLKETIYREVVTNTSIRNFRPISDPNGRGYAYLRGFYNNEDYKDFNADAILQIEY